MDKYGRGYLSNTTWSILNGRGYWYCCGTMENISKKCTDSILLAKIR